MDGRGSKVRLATGSPASSLSLHVTPSAGSLVIRAGGAVPAGQRRRLCVRRAPLLCMGPLKNRHTENFISKDSRPLLKAARQRHETRVLRGLWIKGGSYSR
jgi:hypothetical protein